MKLSARFALLVAVLLSTVVAVAVAGLIGLQSVNHALHGTVEREMAQVLAITHARRELHALGTSERDYMIETDHWARVELAAELEGHRTEVSHLLADLAENAAEEDARQLAILTRASERSLVVDERLLGDIDSGHTDLASEDLAERKRDGAECDAAIVELIRNTERRLAREIVLQDERSQRTRWVEVGVTLFAILIALTVGAAISRGIQRNVAEVTTLNANLEALVAQRTEALAARERAMQMVLDNTGEGLLVVDLDGHVHSERSRAVDEWFPHGVGVDLKAWELLFEPGDDAASMFQMCFEQVSEDCLPFECSADQMPKRVARGDRVFDLAYREIREGEKLVSVLCVVSDATQKVERERKAADATEQAAVIRAVVSDRRGFVFGVTECARLIKSLAGQLDDVTRKRALHTIKGSAAMLGFSSISRAADAFEATLADGDELRPTAAVELDDLLRARLARVADLVRLDARTLEIEERDRDSLVLNLRTGVDHEEILHSVERWEWLPTMATLGRVSGYASHVAERLHKRVEVVVAGHSLRHSPSYLLPFWSSLVHVVRNAVDHGIESPEEREALGKPAVGRLELETDLASDGALLVTISDDGRGIDGQALLDSAARRDVAMIGKTWEDALFADGVSTRAEASDISGRGVGMAAVRASCLAAGGTVEVLTQPGIGTRFVFRFAPSEQVESTAYAETVALAA